MAIKEVKKFIPMKESKDARPVFFGGLIDNADPNDIPYANTPYGRNFRVGSNGITIRPGYTQVSSTTGTGLKNYGIATYDSTPTIVVGYKASSTSYLSTMDPTTYAIANITTGANITSENRMNFLSGGGSIYCMNGVDLYGKLTGTTYSIPASGVSSFRPSFGVYFSNCGWVSGNPGDPNKVYKSLANNLDDYNSTGSDKFTFPYAITGLGCNQQSLYVFSKYTIDVINTATSTNWINKPLETTEGCGNHNLIVSVGKAIYYVTPTNRIKSISPNSLGMYDVSDLSHKPYKGIDKTMASLAMDQSGAFGYAIPSKGIICWHMKTKSATYNDIVIIYNYEFGDWMVDTNKSYSMGTIYNGIPYAISAVNTSIFQDEIGTTDDDAPIQFRYDTKEVDLGDPTAMKVLWQSRLFLAISPNGELTQTIKGDGGTIDTRIISDDDIPNQSSGIGTQAVGTYGIGQEGTQDTLYDIFILRDKGQLWSRCRRYQWSYTTGKSGTQIVLQNLAIQMEIKPFIASGTTYSPLDSNFNTLLAEDGVEMVAEHGITLIT